jgi:hypothetical protein
MYRVHYFFAFFLIIASNVVAQKINADYILNIREVEDAIVIEGDRLNTD